MAKLGSAQVGIELQGRTRYLKPTIEACLELSRRWNGFAGLKAALRREHYDAYVDVICYGLGLEENERRGVEEIVAAAGLFQPDGKANAALLDPIDRYIAILTQGGRPAPEPDPPAGETAPGEAAGG